MSENKIPDINILIDSSEYRGFARINASFTFIDNATGRAYHRLERMVAYEDVKEGVAEIIEQVDNLLDLLVQKNIEHERSQD